MVIDSFEVLARRVMDASASGDWASAIDEWDVITVEEDPAGDGVCICGQPELVKLFTIKNARNGNILYPIGSSCVNKFGREDLNRTVNLYKDLLTLRLAVEANEPVAMTSEYFSRAVLGYLYEWGAFTPDQWNHGDGENDYWFLTDMFNKRSKDKITQRQRSKIRMLIRNKIEPFILTDTRFTSTASAPAGGTRDARPTTDS